MERYKGIKRWVNWESQEWDNSIVIKQINALELVESVFVRKWAAQKQELTTLDRALIPVTITLTQVLILITPVSLFPCKVSQLLRNAC